MRLTAICEMFGRRPIGFLYRGKNRKLRKVNLNHLLKLKKDLEREEQNMLFLRHPYLTIEQEQGHVRHLKEEKFAAFLEAKRQEQTQKFTQPVRIEDRLKNLMVSDSWE